MHYKEILQKAYSVTINNPILWIFGLFLSAGFNLNMAYIGTVGWDKPGEFSRSVWEMFRSWPFAAISGSIAAIVALFLISTFLKTFFVTESHLRIHDVKNKTCPLCISQEQQKTFRQRMPKSYSIGKIAIASIVTIAISVAAAGLLNYAIGQSGSASSPAVLSFSALATIIIICGIGSWNVFAVLFILWYGRSFGSAAQMSFDLISVKIKQVTEFVILLAVIYGALVVVGSVLIITSQYSFTALFAPLQDYSVLKPVSSIIRMLAMIAFWVWLSISNVFFNICLFVFFDELVKPISKEEAIEAVPGVLV
jgi:hypothetical protein